MIKSKSKSDLAFNVINYVVLAFFIIVTLMPIVNIVATSLSSYQDRNILFWVRPEYFDTFAIMSVLTDATFYRAFFITLVVVLCGTAISVLCMTMLGYALSKKNLPFRTTIMMIFLISMLFSGGMVPNYILVMSLGLTDSILALILPSAVMVFHMILIKNFFEGLPDSVEESAKMDGANNFVVLFRIILPMSMSMIVTISLFTAVVYWNNYFNALMYISSSAKNLYPLSYYIVQIDAQFADPNASQTLGKKFFYRENFKAAVIVLSMLPIACTYPFFLKYFTKGVTIGSVKG